MSVNPFALMPVDAAYIHVPFCLRKCRYCHFCSRPPREGEFANYLSALRHEMEAVRASFEGAAQPLAPLRSLYLGGGTPSILPLTDLRAILESVRAIFTLAEGAEITLEANPRRSLTEAFPQLWQMGFNRLSFGLQSANPSFLKILGRDHSPEDLSANLAAARKAGFVNISLDLIFGIPGQTVCGFSRELDWVFRHDFTHLSFYSLQAEEGTSLGDELLSHPERLPDEEEERAIYDLLLRRLPQEGLEAYEISSAARGGFASRHNLVYWQARPYLAFGPSASSYLGGVRRSNTARIDEWTTVWRQAAPAFSTAAVDEIVDGEEAKKEYVLLGLRLLRGVGGRNYRRIFGSCLREDFAPAFASLLKRGLLKETDDGFCLSRRGLDYANEVFREFI